MIARSEMNIPYLSAWLWVVVICLFHLALSRGWHACLLGKGEKEYSWGVRTQNGATSLPCSFCRALTELQANHEQDSRFVAKNAVHSPPGTCLPLPHTTVCNAQPWLNRARSSKKEQPQRAIALVTLQGPIPVIRFFAPPNEQFANGAA